MKKCKGDLGDDSIHRFTSAIILKRSCFTRSCTSGWILLAVDRLPPLRKWLTRKSMGINYRQCLARGIKGGIMSNQHYDVVINGGGDGRRYACMFAGKAVPTGCGD